jgi:hypothetical protein
MEDQEATLRAIPVPLAEALRVALTLDPANRAR